MTDFQIIMLVVISVVGVMVLATLLYMKAMIELSREVKHRFNEEKAIFSRLDHIDAEIQALSSELEAIEPKVEVKE